MTRETHNEDASTKPGLKEDGTAIVQASMSAAAFGFLGLLGHLGQRHRLADSTALAWRFLLAAMVLGAFMIPQWRTRRASALEIRPFLLGALGYASQSMLFFATVKRLGPGKAALLLYTYPAMITLLGWLAGGRKPERGHFAVLGLTTAGCFLVLHSPAGDLSPIGVLLGFTTAFVYSLYLLISEQMLRGIDPASSSFNVCLGTGLSLSIISAAGAYPLIPESVEQYLIITGLALICTVIPTVLLFAAIRQIGSAKAAVCSTLEPVVAASLGALFLGEIYSPRQIIGAAMIVSSIVAVFITAYVNKRVTV